MLRYIIVSLFLSALLFGADDISEKKEAFGERYLKSDRIGTDASHLEMLNSFSQHDIQTTDLNISKYIIDNNIEKLGQTNQNTHAVSVAEDISEQAKSDAFKATIGRNMDHIINDEKLDWGKYLGEYKDQTQNIIDQMKNEDSPYLSKNKFLGAKQRLFVVISSSMPDETIRQYFSDLESVNTDVAFVVRGVMGGPEAIMPTIEYFDKLLIKNKKRDKKEPGNRYNHNITINPKITQRFDIDRVPAVLFVDNYDPIAEAYTGNKKVHDDEDFWVHYGDVEIEYALKTINRSAKRQGLKTLISAMNDSYFKTRKTIEQQ